MSNEAIVNIIKKFEAAQHNAVEAVWDGLIEIKEGINSEQLSKLCECHVETMTSSMVAFLTTMIVKVKAHDPKQNVQKLLSDFEEFIIEDIRIKIRAAGKLI